MLVFHNTFCFPLYLKKIENGTKCLDIQFFSVFLGDTFSTRRLSCAVTSICAAHNYLEPMYLDHNHITQTILELVMHFALHLEIRKIKQNCGKRQTCNVPGKPYGGSVRILRLSLAVYEIRWPNLPNKEEDKIMLREAKHNS